MGEAPVSAENGLPFSTYSGQRRIWAFFTRPLEKVVAETLGLGHQDGKRSDRQRQGIHTGSSSKPTKHPFELVCQEHGPKLRRTKVKHPWTNGMAERFLQTICREFFAVALERGAGGTRGAEDRRS